jgi:hypothetical protein
VRHELRIPQTNSKSLASIFGNDLFSFRTFKMHVRSLICPFTLLRKVRYVRDPLPTICHCDPLLVVSIDGSKTSQSKLIGIISSKSPSASHSRTWQQRSWSECLMLWSFLLVSFFSLPSSSVCLPLHLSSSVYIHIYFEFIWAG